MIKDGGKGSGIKGHTTPEDEIKKNINKVIDPKLRKTLESLLNHINRGDKPQGPTGLEEKETSEKLEEERADIHRYHPKIKNTSKLDRDIKRAKKMEKITKDCNEILRLSGFTVDEEVNPKFKKVMREFGKGELKSSSGEKVTDPKQAKAIAYSEAGETKDSKFEVMYTIGHFHDPETLKDKKEIIQANSAGEARRMIENKWKGNLNRIIQITQVHDSCGEKVFTKGTEDSFGPYGAPFSYSNNFSIQLVAGGYQVEKNGKVIGKAKSYAEAKQIIQNNGGKIYPKGHTEDAEEQWITMNGAHVKIEEGESKESATKKFIKKKGGNPAPEGGSKKSTAPSKPEGSAKTYKPGETLRNSQGKRIGKVEKEFKNIRGEEMVKAMKSPDAWAPTYVKKSDLDHGAGYEAQEATAQEKAEFKKDLDSLTKIEHEYALASMAHDFIQSKDWGGEGSYEAEQLFGKDGEKLSGEDKKLYDKIKNEYNQQRKEGKEYPTTSADKLKSEFFEAEDALREKYMGLDLPIYTYGNVDWEEIRNKFWGQKMKDACSNKDSAIQKECNEILKLSGFIS